MIVRCLASVAALGFATTAWAGPPYETDDPVPTERDHWEIYAFGAAEGLGSDHEGVVGLDLNYGPLNDLQLTATLPLNFERNGGSRLGAGDIELGAKYRFFNREASGVSAAVFPRVILPTASNGFGSGKVGLLLPVWVQKDWQKWSLFGGGGYRLNPGRGNSNYWLASVAVTRTVSDRLSLGLEAKRQGPDVTGGRASTLLGLGGIVSLGGPLSLLFAGGPLFEDGGGPARYHAYTALSINF